MKRERRDPVPRTSQLLFFVAAGGTKLDDRAGWWAKHVFTFWMSIKIIG